jgi:alpha-L-rhamnosidase
MRFEEPAQTVRRRAAAWLSLAWMAFAGSGQAALVPADPRVEWRVNPTGVDTVEPRFSWRVESPGRAQSQSAYRIVAATSPERLAGDQPDLWDSGRVATNDTAGIVYKGRPLVSGQACWWRLKVWDQDSRESGWTEPATWSMGLLRSGDWRAQWITFKDPPGFSASGKALLLPPAHHFRREFRLLKPVRRAVVYASSLGIHELHLNGNRVGDAWFEPGWSDYSRRAYYRSHDITAALRPGTNALGAVLADGWYAGYVGYGLLVGYGPNRSGRSFYGKTPALLVQLEIEYEDGTRERVLSDGTWKVTDRGPHREADLIMGESYDARAEMPGWSEPGFDAKGWSPVTRAESNGKTEAMFSDTMGDRLVDLGFHRPAVLQSYAAPPIRVTEELPARRITEPKPGVYVFDLGQNIAGVIRLKVRGEAGTGVRIRYGEMLHPDGRLMTENLRRARATDFYTLRGDPAGETWSPRFTYHGFQFVELTGLTAKPSLEDVTGLVLHNDTPRVGSFECSDEVMTRFWKNALWTQRANFIEIPTDCPQRDERLGWMGDAQIYARTASFNADVAAFFTKWLDDVTEAQRSFGAYPDYCPYPMSHGEPRKSFGTAWTDAGIICPWTMWRVYGDTRVIERHWASMRRFMEWRMAISPQFQGVSLGNPWGDWLNAGEETPVEYIDACYFAGSARMMSEMAAAIGHSDEAQDYDRLQAQVRDAFRRRYVDPQGALKVNTQTAHVLALAFGLMPETLVSRTADALAAGIEKNGGRMATGFLGTKPLLGVLTEHGHHDLAVRLFQSREFPSWGYEVVNGATTVWERWDSYTREDGFGRHNAAMNSFSHYSFGAVCEWAFRSLAGIDAGEPGYRQFLIRPGPPSPGSNPKVKPIDWVKATYGSVRGPVVSSWKREDQRFLLDLTLPANTTAAVFVPARSADDVQEGGGAAARAPGVTLMRFEDGRAVFRVGSGSYRFVSRLP